jgi:hypothetical protein
MQKSYSASIVLLLFSFCVSAQELPKYIKPQHQETMRAYFAKHRYYRIAPKSLCNCEEDLSWYLEKHPDFHPYYAIGDTNDDGVEDFALGLLDSRNVSDVDSKLTVVVFHGPFHKQKANDGFILFKNWKIQRSHELLSVCAPKIEGQARYPALLQVGPSPFGSDDNISYRYDWSAKKYVPF